HTSPMQVRYMQKHQPPFRIIVTGKCYRRDSDLTHTPMFNQFEGLMIGADVTMEHLKNILKVSMKKILGKEVGVRFRISYFPFVEPGAEFDVTCTICDGLGCATCKHTGWLEMGGCGMVHPNVLTASGVDAEKWQGFAFGFGIERVFMIKHKVNDLRLFFENDVRFLKQF
ncbi:MAG TPA: phenylalanine--tRNA ligase subunit alpha, partial [Patescibacteria group bacterium]|nr:phenylalanine--tRNA ligase subunit alpha [Patescibacteria group bacterium]